jgi:hypothetical protein
VQKGVFFLLSQHYKPTCKNIKKMKSKKIRKKWFHLMSKYGKKKGTFAPNRHIYLETYKKQGKI